MGLCASPLGRSRGPRTCAELLGSQEPRVTEQGTKDTPENPRSCVRYNGSKRKRKVPIRDCRPLPGRPGGGSGPRPGVPDTARAHAQCADAKQGVALSFPTDVVPARPGSGTDEPGRDRAQRASGPDERDGYLRRALPSEETPLRRGGLRRGGRGQRQTPALLLRDRRCRSV